MFRMRKKKPMTYLATICRCLAFSALTLACYGPSIASPNDNPPLSVAVAPFVIEPQPFDKTPSRSDQEQFVRHLSDEATKQAEQSLLEHRIVDAAQQVTSKDVAPGLMVVTGTIRLPISLPPRIIGWNASHRHGTFAIATLILLDPVGTIVFRQEVAVRWGDVWWYSGGKTARNYPQDDVIASLARKAVDHAVRRLDRQKLRAFFQASGSCGETVPK